MIKYGDTDQINIDLLRQANELLERQQRIAAGNRAVAPFSPGGILANEGVARGSRMMGAAGMLVAFGSLATDMFLLGYLYRAGEEGHLDRLLAEVAQAEGGANDEDDRGA